LRRLALWSWVVRVGIVRIGFWRGGSTRNELSNLSEFKWERTGEYLYFSNFLWERFRQNVERKLVPLPNQKARCSHPRFPLNMPPRYIASYMYTCVSFSIISPASPNAKPQTQTPDTPTTHLRMSRPFSLRRRHIPRFLRLNFIEDLCAIKDCVTSILFWMNNGVVDWSAVHCCVGFEVKVQSRQCRYASQDGESRASFSIDAHDLDGFLLAGCGMGLK